MTFYEAALEVLRRNERPLHFKKITEISIRDQLLSHVGRDPAKVMVERLNKEIEMGDDSSLLEPRRGVFDLKAEVRERLNREAQLREKIENENKIVEHSQGRRRRPGQNRDEIDPLSDPSRLSANLALDIAFDEETLKKLDKWRFDTIEEAAYAVLNVTKGRPVPLKQLTGILFDKKLIKFHTHDPETTVKAALVTANQIANRRQKLPPFENYSFSRWGLTEWSITSSARRLRNELEKLTAEVQVETERQLASALTSLKPEALEMVLMSLLELLDYNNVKVSKRTANGDVLFTADWSRGFTPTRVCIQIIGNNQSIVNEKMIHELREDLPHYSGEEGVIIHLGKVSQDAISATKDTSKTKITVLERDTLVSLLMRHRIGVRTFNQPLIMLDRHFFETLS